MTALQTSKYRLYPSQKRLLDYNLAVSRYGDNRCLGKCKVTGEQKQGSISENDQNKKEKYFRQTFCTQHHVHRHMIQTMTDDLNRAQASLRLCRVI